jgi:hypothetical protein
MCTAGQSISPGGATTYLPPAGPAATVHALGRIAALGRNFSLDRVRAPLAPMAADLRLHLARDALSSQAQLTLSASVPTTAANSAAIARFWFSVTCSGIGSSGAGTLPGVCASPNDPTPVLWTDTLRAQLTGHELATSGAYPVRLGRLLLDGQAEQCFSNADVEVGGRPVP